ncbi:cytochrome b [Magnetospirillum aberrantis]|uniref:Cytochrome b n=1 Tax=Magnetospirillum aberrantis SpK TaxID=908842 RepID=A0A7C9UUT0_9PROT|nr:cytochrome b [Magnetospirillum aberrantis]NFV78972.1 cytochrome b [Magnetospirillum aberrantis SpK]
MSSSSRYDPVAKSLHWLMAALIIGLWGVGLGMEELPKGDLRSQIIGLHKALGVVVLALVVVRLAWRATHSAPTLPATMPAWEQLGAKLGHLALYGLMIAIPAAGILMSQSAGRDVNVFGWILPTLVEKSDDLKEVFGEAHETLAWLLAVVLVVHVVAALRHHFMLKDDVLSRMLPRRG